MAKANGSKALMKRDQGAVAAGGGYDSFASPTGKAAGAETATSADLSIPRLYMLQPMSPQVAKKSEKIDGAAAGMIFNTVTREVYEKLYVVACCYRRTYAEWVARDEGGGFVAEHLAVDPKWVKDQRGPYTIPAKQTADKKTHIINDTRNFFLLYAEEVDKAGLLASPQNALASLTATAIRPAANWLTVLTSKEFKSQSGKIGRLPIFASITEVTSEQRENEDGTWFTWVFTDTGVLVPEGSELLARAAEFYRMASDFKVSAPAPVQQAEGDTGSM